MIQRNHLFASMQGRSEYNLFWVTGCLFIWFPKLFQNDFTFMDRAKTWVFGERVINFEEVHNVHFVEAENF